MALASVREWIGRAKSAVVLGAGVVAVSSAYFVSVGNNLASINTFISSWWKGGGEPKLQISAVAIEATAMKEVRRYVWSAGAYGIAFNVRKAYGVSLTGCVVQVSHPTKSLMVNDKLREAGPFDVPADVESIRKTIVPAGDYPGEYLGGVRTKVYLECNEAVTEPIPLPALPPYATRGGAVK